MHVIVKKGLALSTAAAGLLFAGAGAAQAGTASATGHADLSPGVVSGNNVQAPVNIPVCVNGNTAQVIGAFNWSAHNRCKQGPGESATLTQSAHLSPGIVSGNNVGLPINAPIGVNGNTVSVIGAFNGSFGNTSLF